MGYGAALKKAYDSLRGLYGKETVSLRFLSDTYTVDPGIESVTSISGKPVKDFLVILLLHYVIGKARGSFSASGQFVSFKDIENGEFYYPAFREGAIKPLIKKFGDSPEKIFGLSDRFNARKIESGDAAVEIDTFDDIPVRIILWRGDEEFPPEATILFDKNLFYIYTTEDIAVFLRVVAHNL